MVQSLPLRERGLKLADYGHFVIGTAVAPFAGAWIEIGKVIAKKSGSAVAPFAGAWIEIEQEITALMEHPSLPLRERGLKYQ